MTPAFLPHYVHLVVSVLLTGYALFWVIMAIGLGREESPAEGSRLLRVINAGRWPPGIPWSLRLPFPGVAWLFLLVLAATGLALMPGVPGAIGPVLGVKLGLVVLLVAGHGVATWRPTRGLAFVNGAVALAILLLSILLRRWSA
jgi:hypothetical protein